MTEIIKQAEEEYKTDSKVEMNLSEYLDSLKNNPEWAVDSSQYLLNAINHFGTRKVIEKGEEKERYIFFDDPKNNGEHAVLGNTENLNRFVKSLERKTRSEINNNKIIWFTGPTATGKSEFKRCLFNGIQEYAKTEEGRRFTLEWSIDSLSGDSLTYGNQNYESKKWYKSPVNVNPLSVLPDKTKEKVFESLPSEYSYDTDSDLDPFSKEAYNFLENEYDSFSDVISSKHVKVVSYIPTAGDGLGVLQSEDGGNPKQKLVGSWMQDALNDYASRGRKNAQAFTYDGLLSQGNSCISVVEDAQNHPEIFHSMMNICEEDFVKLDNKIGMDLDTLIICISNPDFEAGLKEFADAGPQDPFKAVRRRLEQYNLDYLTSFVLETQLIKKHLTDWNEVWNGEDVEELIEECGDSVEIFDTHISPHGLEAAAMYNVVSRLFGGRIQTSEGNIDKIERALYYDRGYHLTDNGKVEIDSREVNVFQDGKTGIPVTFTNDVISQLSQKEDVVMYYDIIEEMRELIFTNALFSDDEKEEFNQLASLIYEYTDSEVEHDIKRAIMGDKLVSNKEVKKYVENLFEWDEGNEDEYDEVFIEEFERRYLQIPESEYKSETTTILKNFRKTQIINPVNTYIWNNDIDFGDIDYLSTDLLGPLFYVSWNQIESEYKNLNLNQWRDPPKNSQTEEVKSHTIENMKEMGYTDESANRAVIRISDLFSVEIGDQQ